MQTRILGKDGPELTVIGFGAWAIGGPWQFGWGEVNDDESIDAIHTAIDLGINWIDTAAVYGFGHSEEVVGKALEGIRTKVFIATKCGLINDGSGNAVNNLQPKSIRREIEDSLRRLRTDYIDLYQIHKPDPTVTVEESWQEMIRLKEEGKAKYIGVSTYDTSLLERCFKLGLLQSLQPAYNLLKREAAEEVLPYCLKNEIGVVAYSPMQAGLLTGSFDINKLAVDDWRRKNSYYSEPRLGKTIQFVEKLKPLAAKQNKTVGHLAVAWVLKNPAVTSAIVGARNSGQVKKNVLAIEYLLSDKECNLIEELLNEFSL
jgi:aryl-alcohol dehydrogenase-like predicted oxidoreductase